MDTNNKLLMLIVENKPISSKDVDKIDIDATGSGYTITFKNKTTCHVDVSDFYTLKGPTCLNPQSYRIRHNGILLDDVSVIYVFKDPKENNAEYWRVCNSMGNERDYRKDELEIDKLDSIKKICMLIGKGKPISSEVQGKYDNRTSKFEITFKSGKTYSYKDFNVYTLNDPVSLNPQSYRIRHNGILFDNVSAIYVFKDRRENDKEYCRICDSMGNERDFCKDDLELEYALSYILVITEKPSVAETYAKVLGAKEVLGVDNKKSNYLEGNGYLISWCIGHLFELVKPEVYDKKYNRWNIDNLPIFPETWKYQIKSEDHKKQFDVLNQLMNRNDVSEILCATDAGREGERIFRLIYQQAECKKPFRRIWLSSLEESAIREAFANPKPSSDYDNLYEAARCRALADWIVGMNATPFFTCLYNCDKPLSVGRVKSPTLAMIVDRENEIERHIPKSYYTVNLNVGGVNFESRRFDTEDEATQVEQNCREAISVNS